jgi:hypothetical protein
LYDSDFRGHGSISPFSFGQQNTGSAHLGRNVPLFRQAVLDGQNCLLVVDVHGRLEAELRDEGGIDVDYARLGMFSQKVAAATLALFAYASFGLLKATNVLGALRDPHGVWFPQGEGIYRTC